MLPPTKFNSADVRDVCVSLVVGMESVWRKYLRDIPVYDICEHGVLTWFEGRVTCAMGHVLGKQSGAQFDQ